MNDDAVTASKGAASTPSTSAPRDPWRDFLDRLGEEGWRERKHAVEALLKLVSDEAPDAAVLSSLVDRLVAIATTHPYPSARAAAQECLVGLGPDVLLTLVPRIATRDPIVRPLVEVAARLADTSLVPLLVELSLDTALDENLRAAAADALGQLGGPQASTALERLLDDPSEMLQLYALDGLKACGTVVPVERLEPFLAQVAARRAAVALLGQSPSAEAVARLVPLLGDRMAAVRATAVCAMAELHRAANRAGRPSRVAQIAAGASPDTRRAIRDLVDHREPEVRRAAATLAALCVDGSALPRLVAHAEDAVVQEQASQLVGKLGAAANAALVESAATLDPARREVLFRLIAAMRSEVVDPRLMELAVAGLSEPIDSIAVAAATALRYVGGRAAMAALFRRCDTEGPVGEAAADAIAEITTRVGAGRHDDLDLLAGATWPEEGPLARNLCRIAARLASIEHVAPLVSLLGSRDTRVRVAAALALGKIHGEHEGVAALCFGLADEEPTVRAAACRSLGVLRSPQSFQPLLSATADPSPLVRAAAVQALVALDNPVALARLREIIMDDPSPSVIVHAIAGLGTSRLEQDLGLLMSLCASEDHEVTKSAARALRAFPAHRATAALLGLLSHARWDVRLASAEVLAARGDATAIPSLRSAASDERDALVLEVLQRGITQLETVGGGRR